MANKCLILRGNILFTLQADEFAVHENSYVVVSGGLIQGLYQDLPQEYQGMPIEDYGQKLIIPGFVDLHTHAAQFHQRGCGLDLELLDWLNKYTFPEEDKFHNIDYANKVYEHFADDVLRHGTTRVVAFGTIHLESTKRLFDILVQKGIGAYVGKVNMDANCPDFLRENTERALFEAEEFLAKTSSNSLVKPIITPRFAPTSTKELLRGLGALAVKYSMPVQSHLAENVNEVALVKQLFPEQLEYYKVYEHFNLFGQTPTLMAHCIHLADEAIGCMARNRVFAVHCPDSNMNLTSGIMPIRKLLSAGVPVGLGSDIGAGQTLNMTEAIVKAIQLSKLKYLGDHAQPPLTLAEAFYLATKGGGSFFGKVGSFEPGYVFDALVIADEVYDEEFTPAERLQRFIYLGDSSEIAARYVAGNKL